MIVTFEAIVVEVALRETDVVVVLIFNILYVEFEKSLTFPFEVIFELMLTLAALILALYVVTTSRLLEVAETSETVEIVAELTAIARFETVELDVIVTRFAPDVLVKRVLETIESVFEVVTFPPRSVDVANRVFAPKYPITVPLPVVVPPNAVVSVVTAFVEITATN